MTKKNFAAIMSAKENMRNIETVLEEAMHNPTRAYAAAKTALEMAKKWNNDFGDVDPGWQPPEKAAPTENAAQRAMALGAFIQQPAKVPA